MPPFYHSLLLILICLPLNGMKRKAPESPSVNTRHTKAKLKVNHTATEELITLLRESDYTLREVQELVTKGADLTHEDQHGHTVLHRAAGTGDKELVQYCLSQGVPIDIRTGEEGATPLHMAALMNHPQIVDLLCSQALAIDTQDKNGNTALHYAARQCNTECARLLLAQGANEQLPNAQGNTPASYRYYSDILEHITQAWERGDLEAVARLQQSHTQKHNMPLLISAVRLGLVPLVKTLLHLGVSPDEENGDGYTALHIAAMTGNTYVCRVLLEHGAKVDSTDRYEFTPLMSAASTGHIGCCRELLHYGADINYYTKALGNMTALHAAAHQNQAQACTFLVMNGIQPLARNQFGKTAIQVAFDKEHYEASWNILSHTFLLPPHEQRSRIWGALRTALSYFRTPASTPSSRILHLLWVLGKQKQLPHDIAHAIIAHIAELHDDIFSVVVPRLHRNAKKKRRLLEYIPAAFHAIVQEKCYQYTLKTLEAETDTVKMEELQKNIWITTKQRLS